MSKPKQKVLSLPKPGKVVRLNKKLVKLIQAHKTEDETWSAAINRLVESGVDRSHKWTLPSKLFDKRSEARGQAIKDAVAAGLTIEHSEQPIKVVEEK